MNKCKTPSSWDPARGISSVYGSFSIDDTDQKLHTIPESPPPPFRFLPASPHAMPAVFPKSSKIRLQTRSQSTSNRKETCCHRDSLTVSSILDHLTIKSHFSTIDQMMVVSQNRSKKKTFWSPRRMGSDDPRHLWRERGWSCPAGVQLTMLISRTKQPTANMCTSQAPHKTPVWNDTYTTPLWNYESLLPVAPLKPMEKKQRLDHPHFIPLFCSPFGWIIPMLSHCFFFPLSETFFWMVNSVLWAVFGALSHLWGSPPSIRPQRCKTHIQGLLILECLGWKPSQVLFKNPYFFETTSKNTPKKTAL